MSTVPVTDNVLIGREANAEQIRATLVSILGPQTGPDSFLVTASVVADLANGVELEDERGVPLSKFTHILEVRSTVSHDLRSQESAARQIYETLAKATDWPLLLTKDDVSEVVASRLADAAA